MAKASAKQTTSQAVIAFDGGLNRADNPDALAENQLADVSNMFYEGGQNILTTRPGLVHVAGPPAGNPAILRLHYHVKDALTACLVAATSDGKLYTLDEASSPPAWTPLADLFMAGVTPSLATFNGKLIIADGGPHLRVWDGATVADLKDSPSATALAEIGGRLAANSAQDLDGVVLSGPEDETNWQIADGSVFLRAGYGDGLRVTGFGVISQDLIIFKSGASGKRIMRLQASGSTAQWSLSQISRNLTAVSPHAVEFVGNNLLFADAGGIMDLAGVQQYGDIQVGGAGRLVNPVLGGKNVSELRFLPKLAVLLAFVEGDNQVLVFHPHNGAWTRFDFQGLFLHTACQAGDTIALAGQGGRLYRLGLTESRDEVAPGLYTDIAGLARSKVFAIPGETVLRKTRLDYEAITPGQGRLCVFGSDQVSPVPLLTWSADPGLGTLAEATGPLADANQPLGASAEAQSIARSRFRDCALSFQITTVSGRIRLRQCLAQLAAVNG